MNPATEALKEIKEANSFFNKTGRELIEESQSKSDLASIKRRDALCEGDENE